MSSSFPRVKVAASGQERLLGSWVLVRDLGVAWDWSQAFPQEMDPACS